MPAHDPERTTDPPTGAPEAGSDGTAEQTRTGPSADPDRTITRDRTDPATDPTLVAARTPGSSTGTFGPSRAPAGFPSVPGYEIESVLGRGGMGVVYQARHLTLKRTVALKMVLAGAHAGPSELARFRIEAEAVARLQHPNIVQIHDVGEADGHPYCALEFVAGGSLSAKLKDRLLAAAESARLIETLARAMQLAHSRNVIHRDLKPANVLLTTDGAPKITDFGLARRLDSDSGETHDGAVMGTPSYMAPEQASGRAHEAGPAADVYALGAILYQCLTGRPPFKGETLVETLDQVRTRDPVPPSHERPGVPLDLETICLKCLCKEPERRYASAAELADELGRYLRGEPILARPVGRVERGRRWCRRNPALAAAAVVVVGALVASSVVSTLSLFQVGKKNTELEETNNQLGEANTELERTVGRLVRSQADVVNKSTELEKVNTDLKKANTELLQLDDKKEGLLVRTWLSPLADAPSPYLNSAELFAFSELSASSDARKQRFLNEALKPEWRRKLGARAEFVLQAAVGLDTRQRGEVERLLVRDLERFDPADPARFDLALAVAGLGAVSPSSAAVVSKVLVEALAALAKAHAQGLPTSEKPQYLAQALVRVASRLEPKEAGRVSAEAVAALTQAMNATTGRNAHHVLQALADGVVIVAPGLEPGDAATSAATVTRAVTQSNSAFGLKPWVQVLSAVAPRLGPEAAAKTAAALSQALGAAGHPDSAQTLVECLAAVAPRLDPKAAASNAAALGRAINDSKANRVLSLQHQAEGLAALAARLEPAEATRLTAAAATVLTDTLSARMNEQPSVQALTLGLAALAPRMEPKTAAAAAALLIRAVKENAPFALQYPARALAAVAARLEPEDAARVAEACAQAVTKMFDTNVLQHLAQALVTVAPRLEPKDAAATATALARGLNDQNTFAAEYRLQGLSAVAPRLEPKDAAAVAELLTKDLNANNVFAFVPLVRGLSAVAGRLDQKGASAVAEVLAKAVRAQLANPADPLGEAALCLAAVAARMEPKDAARVSAETAPRLVQALALAQTRNVSALSRPPLVKGLLALAVRLELAEEARLAAGAAAALARAMTQVEIAHPDLLFPLAQNLAAVAARMEPESASKVATEAVAVLTRAMQRAVTKPQAERELATLAQGLAGLASRMDPKDASRASVATAAVLTRAMNKDFREFGAEGTFLVLEGTKLLEQGLSAVLGDGPRPGGGTGGLSDQQLVDLLKEPLCVGAARRAVLDRLGRRYGRVFVDQWDFVHFAEEKKLGLDFTRPPPRP